MSKNIVLGCASLSIAVVLCVPAIADPPRVRKNIDDLSSTELQNYIYAVNKLEEKSKLDPTVAGSYAFYAGLHNTPRLFKGACEHRNDKFLPWHRAMLWYFEDALRAVDPPRTKDVTIPYWNWSVSPTGMRYAKEFEDTSSILSQSVDGIQKNTAASQPMFPWKYAEGQALVAGYPAFAGLNSGGEGTVEANMHDSMHGTYIGGALVSTSTAANDPVFWSFHAFIDVLWWWRQQNVHDDQVTCGTCTLRGMPGVLASGQPGPKIVNDVVNAEQLGFTYAFTPPPAVVAAVAHQAFSAELPQVAELSLAPAQKFVRLPVKLPASGAGNVELTLEKVKAADKIPYMAFVYLHPKSVPFAPHDAAFRDKYLVAQYGEWLSMMGGMPMAYNRHFTIDRESYPSIFGEDARSLEVDVAVHVPAGAAGAPARNGAPLALSRPKPAGPAFKLELSKEVKIGGAELSNE